MEKQHTTTRLKEISTNIYVIFWSLNLCPHGEPWGYDNENKYKDLKGRLPKGRELRKLDKKQLQSFYRDIKYISNLKSSTVKGALATKNKFEPIRDRLNTLSKTQQEKFWEIYGKFYETNATMEKFKYEIFNESIDEVFGATETDKIVQDIIDEYNETLKDLGSEADVEQIRKKLFTNKLDKMYK